MISGASGIVLIGISAACFWSLLPQNGEIHPLVRNADLSSLIAIGILTVFTIGMVLLFGTLIG